MRFVRDVLISACLLAACACIPKPLVPAFEAGDLRPPAVVSWGSEGPRNVRIVFDEALSDALHSFTASDDEIEGIEIDDNKHELKVLMKTDQVPGKRYTLSGIVEDVKGNMSSFILPYWGFNPEPPELLINEVLSVKSKTHHEVVELYVKKGGNCAGCVFYNGVPDDFEYMYMFPALRVKTGDYIVLHLRPQGLGDEVDELSDKTASGGLDATAGAWDVWYRGDKAGLPDKVGILSIYSSPAKNAAMDALVYIDKHDAFPQGKFQERFNSAVRDKLWNVSEPPRPSDCFFAKKTTSTKTMCRSSMSGDTDTASDWHIVPTKKASIGFVNSDEKETEK